MILNQLKRFVLLPPLGEDEKDRVAGILGPTSVAVLVGVGVLFLVRILVDEVRHLVPLFLLCVDMSIVLVMIRRGRLSLASLLALWGLLLFLNFMIMTNDGIHDNALLAYPGILVVGGLVLSRRSYNLLSLGALVSVVGTGILEYGGIIQTSLSFRTTLLDVFDLMVLVAVNSIAIRLFSDNLLKALTRARTGENELRLQSEKLRSSEEKFHTAFHSTRVAMAIQDDEDRFVEMNDTFCSMTGYDRVEMLGRSGRTMNLWAEPAQRKQAHEILDREGRLSGFEFRFRRKSGEERIGEMWAEFVDLEGVRCTLSTVLDVTERKKAEEELLIKDIAIESSISAIGLANLDSKIIFANQAFLRLWGYKESREVVGRPIADFAVLGESETRVVVETMMAGSGYTAESLGLRSDGSTFHLQLSANLVRSREGKPICMMASFLDITERQAAEDALRKSESTLHAFMDALPVPAFMIDRQGTLLAANRSFGESMARDVSSMDNRNVFDYLPKELAGRRRMQIDAAFETKRSISFEDENSGASFINYVEPIPDAGDGRERVAIFALDITDRKTIERALERSEREYRGLFENAHDAIVIFEPGSETVLDANQRACDMYGFSKEEFIGMSLLPLSKDLVAGKKHIETTLNERRIQEMVTTHYRKDHSEMLIEVNASVVDFRGQLAILSIHRDITERKRMEIALREQEATYREAIAQADAVPYRLSYYPHEYVFLGEGIERLTGFKPEEMTPQVFRGLVQEVVMRGKAEGVTNTDAAKAALRGEFKEWRADNKIKDRDGVTRWLADAAIQVFDGNGVPVGSVGILQDITARKQTEEQILASLHEKEVLLKEIHHRVKNNLQVISSLLNLQAAHLKDEMVKSVFKESQNRIRSMALVHEYLYRSTNLSRITFSDYVSRFLAEIFRSYSSKVGNVRLKTVVEDVMLSIEEAIPCGLIINELVSNSLKYAFPDKKDGEILVQMRAVNDGRWELIVQDDGVGLPSGFRFENTATLGMQLIDSFVRQLGATVRVGSSGGTKFQIIFGIKERGDAPGTIRAVTEDESFRV